MSDRKNGVQSGQDNSKGGGRAGRRRFMKTAGVFASAVATGLGLDGCGEGGISAASAQSVGARIPAIVPAQTALVVMHYQTDILALFPAVAPTLLANTRKLCDAARAKGVSVYFAKIQFSPGYPEVSPLNKNGQGLKQLGLFINDRIAPELGQQANEPLIIGHRASVFFGTDLQARLSAQGIDSLIMAGIASTGVVLSSVAYASDSDFRLYTVKDCCFDPDQVVHDHLFSTAFDSRTTVLSLADASLLLA
jgi:nicotinamidase-related amidase